MFGAKHKAKRSEEQFPIEIEKCKELGARLVQKAKDAKAGLIQREEIRFPKEMIAMFQD